MKNLQIGSVEIPINAATKTFAVLAKRGAGKTYTAAVMAEEFAKNSIPFVVFDPIDVWWGLRLNKDGKSKGLPVVVFGLEHADIKIDRDMGRKIAQAVVSKNISCVISTFGMPKVAQRHLIAEFSEELLNINNTPRHIFIEEAHEFVPQRVQGGLAKCFSAVEALVVMGRNRGIGVTLINQRAATLNKDVLTQLDTLLAFRNVAPQDRKALKEWVEAHSAEGDFSKFMDSLPSLPTGEGWIWSPEFMNIFERIKIRKRETFHPDREKLGDNFVMPELDSQDIDQFIREFSKKEEKPHPDVNRPGRIGKIKTEPMQEKINVVTTEALEKARQDTIHMKNDYESRLIQKDTEIRSLQNVLLKIRSILGVESLQEVSMTFTKNGSMIENLPPYEQSIMTAIMKHPSIPFTRGQLAVHCGKSSKSSAYQMAISRLVKLDLIKKNGSELIYKD